MKNETHLTLPLIPIRDRVVFPGHTVSLVVGREKSIAAVRAAMSRDRRALIVSQRNMKVEDPSREDLYAVGVVADLIQTVQMPDGFLRVKLSARQRARLLEVGLLNGGLTGDLALVESDPAGTEAPLELEALRRVIVKQFEDYSKKIGRLPPDVVERAVGATSFEELVDAVADSLFINISEKQDLLELLDAKKRMERLIRILDSELEILQLERKIQNRVHRQIEKSQREYYLNEQIRAIQRELKKKDDAGQEIDAVREKIKKLGMPPAVEEAALKETDRLEKMMPFSPEATVVRGYLDWMTSLPWSTSTRDKIEMDRSKKILDEDHYGLDKPKERILEYIAVLKLTRSIKGPVLCFIGPPGTGKTSIAKSMARALGRKFVRISLGGIRDEAEIRGHRRTYIGSMPGRIIQGLKRAGSNNPIFLLDEVDKMGSDWRGDPSSALLEVLDPEQNNFFTDHFLDVGFDLSKVIFICTANSLYDIPRTLRDRMEVIRFSAYTTEEKVSIARQFLLNREIEEHGLPAGAIRIDDEALRKLIHLYTQEAGVRELRRKIATLCRKVAVEWVKKKAVDAKKKAVIKIALNDFSTYLGPPEFIRQKASPNAVGIATGLAWTEHGGETLTIEVTIVPGTGKILLTGKLGNVMQESAQAAISWVKSRASSLKISGKKLYKMDLHVHVPEGAVPKDGPSAGIALAVAIASALTGRPVREEMAMTGEMTLRGRVLGIGGFKEKVLAAYREGLKTVLFPKSNEKDLAEIPESVRKNIKLIAVESIDQVIDQVFRPSTPRSSTSRSSVGFGVRNADLRRS